MAGPVRVRSALGTVRLASGRVGWRGVSPRPSELSYRAIATRPRSSVTRLALLPLQPELARCRGAADRAGRDCHVRDDPRLVPKFGPAMPPDCGVDYLRPANGRPPTESVRNGWCRSYLSSSPPSSATATWSSRMRSVHSCWSSVQPRSTGCCARRVSRTG
jgi:hypothetical protein